MENQDAAVSGGARRWLPWAAFAVAWAFYLITMCGGATPASLPVVSRVAGWDAAPALAAPLHYLITLPFGALPAVSLPFALNGLSTFLGALVLGLLARSVMLLPHDRTREQRQREQSEDSLLTIPLWWIPPLFAALVCGLQLTFWEHATMASVDILDVAVFATLIWCMLEYRVGLREGWLYLFSFLYGIGVTNNWALIAFFPVALAAVIWIRGRNFLEIEFLARMAVWGVLGLGLYVLLPLLASFQDPSLRFWDYLRTELGSQKEALGLFKKSRTLLLSMTSVLPVLIMGIRWPSSFGDTSAAGAMLTNFMFRVVHGMMLAATLWVAFDPKFSPRSLGGGFAFLPFHYLGALAVGYFAGYFLLVFADSTSNKAWRRPKPFDRFIHKLIFVTVCVAAVVIPAGMLLRNHGYVKMSNGPALKTLAEAAAKSLPETGGILISDDPYLLMAYAYGLGASPNANRFILVDSPSLLRPLRHRQFSRRHPGRWPTTFASWNNEELVDSESVAHFLQHLSVSNSIYYAHPSVGYYFESFQARPEGLPLKLELYTTNAIAAPVTAEESQRNTVFWQQIAPALDQVLSQVQLGVTNGLILGAWWSRAANNWGVELQRLGRLDDAGRFFELAHKLNPESLNASVNSRFNSGLRKGTPATVLTETEFSMLSQFGYIEQALVANGPFDEPDACLRTGRQLSRSGNYRQALTYYDRARVLAPSNLHAILAAADMYLLGQMPDKAVELITAVRSRFAQELKASTNEVEVIRLEALALLGKGRLSEAESQLLAAERQNLNNETILGTLFTLYIGNGRLTNALDVIDRQLKANPKNVTALVNRGAMLMQLDDHARAIEPLTQVLQLEPSNLIARRYRAMSYLRENKLDESERDYENLREATPRSYAVYYGLGEIAYRRKSPDAIGHYKKFVEYAPRGVPEIDFVNKRLDELKARPAN